MRKAKRWIIVAALVLLPLLALGAANYPSSLPDATHVSQSLSQTRTNTIIDEIYALAAELGLNFGQHGKANLLQNGSVEVWSAGASAAPDGWTLSGTGAAVARQADGQDDTYSAQITAGSAASKLEQTVAATISAAVNTRLRGTISLTLAARVKASATSACRLQISDGVGSSQSSYHSGGGAWEYLSVTRTLDTSATTLLADLLNDKTDSSTTCRFDSAMLLEGKFTQKAFAPRAGDVNAATATALAANPADCADGTRATGIAANGDLTCSAVGVSPRSYLAGLGLANNGTDANNDVDVAVGQCRNADNDGDMILASALTKQLDAAWAVGTNAGGLDTGAKAANTWYHLWLIKRTDTGVVDALFSTSATAPTMPTSYDEKRRIGAVLTDGSSNIIAFKQRGDWFRWVTPVNDVNATNPGTAAVTRSLTVPAGVVVDADLAVRVLLATNTTVYGLITALDEADSAPGQTMFNCGGRVSAVTAAAITTLRVKTDTSRQVRSRLANSGASDALIMMTFGWWDSRGRDE